MADQPTCLQNAQKLDPRARLCATWVCEQDPARAQVTAFCHCQPPYPKQNPCPYGANTPVVVYDSPTSTCFCCCSCFAYDTPIADTPESARPIQSFAVGHQVLASGPELDWKPAAVEFSSGVEPSEKHGKTVATVYYGDAGKESSLVVTPDHVFLVRADGAKDLSITRAVKLVPGKDRLIAPDGSDVPLLGVELGAWYRGLHHIATTNTPAKDLEDHLLISGGVVTADWAVQISHLDDAPFAGMHATGDAPEIGGAEFEATHEDAARGRFTAAAGGVDLEALRPAGFRPYGEEVLDVPETAMTFVNRKQAEDILANAHQSPIGGGGQEVAFYLFKVMNAFYPDIHFDLAWDETTPNAYSFRKYGLDVVVLTGGLVRTEGMSVDGLALVLAHEIGHLIGGEPLDPAGLYSCQGQADYAAVAAVLRGIYWPTDYPVKATGGIAQVEQLFEFIDPKDREGKKGNTCNGISTECRLRAMRAGLMFAPLPDCAGGPEVPFLKPVAVRAVAEGDGAQVTVTFNLPLDAASVRATDVRFEPDAEVMSAAVDPAFTEAMVVEAGLQAGGQYEMTIENVISAGGKELHDGKVVIPIRVDTA